MIGYTEWLEQMLMELEPSEVCDTLTEKSPEWCEENCQYFSADCLKEYYRVCTGGAE